MNRRLQSWFPTIVKYSGLVLAFFTVIFWVVTDRLNGELLAFFGLMMGLGEAMGALRDLGNEKPKPPEEPKA